MVDSTGKWLTQGSVFHLATFLSCGALTSLATICRFKDTTESLRSKQDKEREAAGNVIPARGGGAPRGSGSSRGGAPVRGGAQNRGSQAPGRSLSRGGGGGGFNSRGGGARGGGGMNSQSRGGSSSIWIHLIDTLKKKELLPVVVFTFSKKRCEENAASMPNTDLCSAAEKSEVHIAIERSLTRLKGEWR